MRGLRKPVHLPSKISLNIAQDLATDCDDLVVSVVKTDAATNTTFVSKSKKPRPVGQTMTGSDTSTSNNDGNNNNEPPKDKDFNGIAASVSSSSGSSIDGNMNMSSNNSISTSTQGSPKGNQTKIKKNRESDHDLFHQLMGDEALPYLSGNTGTNQVK